MSDKTPTRVTDLRHLELIEGEVTRHRQNALRIRLASLAIVAAFVAFHGAQSNPRYMFLAPAIAIAAWALDAHTDWHVRALRTLASALRGEISPLPAALSLDTEAYAHRVSWRGAILRPARAMLYHPFVTLAAFVAVDAAQLDTHGFNAELAWYCVVTFASFVTMLLVAWSWWYDHFGEPVVAVRAVNFTPAEPPPEPRPSVAPDTATRPFGTAVG